MMGVTGRSGSTPVFRSAVRAPVQINVKNVDYRILQGHRPGKYMTHTKASTSGPPLAEKRMMRRSLVCLGGTSSVALLTFRKNSSPLPSLSAGATAGRPGLGCFRLWTAHLLALGTGQKKLRVYHPWHSTFHWFISQSTTWPWSNMAMVINVQA